MTIPGNVGSYKVVAIGENAFYWYTSLKSVVIPDSVTSISKWAFYNCKLLTSVEIPSSVTSIDEDAFKRCESLTIICSSGSYAEGYAKENGIAYKLK